MKNILVVLCMLATMAVSSQSKYNTYSWNTIPAQNLVDTVKPIDGVLVTLERRITETYINKDDIFEDLVIFHQKQRLTSNKAVSENNKVYISMNKVLEIVSIKARFISPSGKITELPAESIKKIENLENKGDFSTFAIEGAEVGGELEYYYILRKQYNPYGSIYIQDDVPKCDVTIIYSYPNKLDYLFKSYNNLPLFDVDEGDSAKEAKCQINYVPALEEERYGVYRANLMRFEFTLTHNKYNSIHRVYSLAKAANSIYGNYYEYTDDEQKAVKKLLQKLDATNPSFQNLQKLENWVKTEINIDEEVEVSTIEEILKLKHCSEFGALRLFVALYEVGGFDFKLVCTSNIEDKAFDPEYSGFNYLSEFCLYFPTFDKYLMPDNAFVRVGYAAENMQGEYGLFMNPVMINDKLRTLGYSIEFIKPCPFDYNTDSMHVDLHINLDNNELNAKIVRAFTGSLAFGVQSIWNLMDDERKNQLLEAYFNMGSTNTHISTFTTAGNSPADMGIKPFVWDVELIAKDLVELAGNNLVIKIGNTIGEQAELYQDKQRRLPVRLDMLKKYYRKIQLEVPQGYAIEDFKDLEMKVEMENQGKISCAFYSSAQLIGNKLEIISTEYYTEFDYPSDRYEEFRKVINAAADFNKKTILLKKL